MPSASELTPEDRFVGLFVGRSGSGKTVASCSFAEEGLLEVLDFDGRIRGILGAPWLDPFRKNINYTYFPPRQAGIIDTINKKLESWLVASNVGQFHAKTVVVSSLTSQCATIVQAALPLTHANNKGMSFGTINLTGPEDYKYESQATLSILSFLRSIPRINIIVEAHIVPKWGKAPGSDGKFSENVQIGEKLSITDKLGENCLIYFDHKFRFDRSEDGRRHTVRFRSDLAQTSYSGLPDGDVDLTGKSFYQVLKGLTSQKKEETLVK